jgi:hypothetical protein
VASSPAVDYGKLFNKNLEKTKIKGITENCGNYE